MTISQQLHDSKTHHAAADSNCPVCRAAYLEEWLKRDAEWDRKEPEDRK